MGTHQFRSEYEAGVIHVAGWSIQKGYFEMTKKPKKRIQEPSTWAGVSGALAAAASLPIPAAQPWLAGFAGIAGAVAVWLREGEKTQK